MGDGATGIVIMSVCILMIVIQGVQLALLARRYRMDVEMLRCRCSELERRVSEIDHDVPISC